MRGLDRLHPNSVSLYYDKDGKGGVTASVLVEAALRMRIGRLFLQEIRDGVGAIAFLLALQTGHTGGITTIHASDCLAVFDRLRVLVKQAPGGASISDTDITTQLRSLVDVIVHAGRDGSTFKVDEVWFRACPDVMGKSDERGVAAFSGESGAVAGRPGRRSPNPARFFSREARSCSGRRSFGRPRWVDCRRLLPVRPVRRPRRQVGCSRGWRGGCMP